MTNLNELDKQIENQTLLKKIKECFDDNTSIDEMCIRDRQEVAVAHDKLIVTGV